MIPVLAKQHLLLDPDTRVGAVSLPNFEEYDVEIRPWYNKRLPSDGPVWYEATWESPWFLSSTPDARITKNGITYIWTSPGTWTRLAGRVRVRGFYHLRYKKVLTKREVQKLHLVEPKAIVTVRSLRFSLQKLYGLKPGTHIVFKQGTEWVQGVVGVYDKWRDNWRVERNQKSKKDSSHRRYLRRATWLDRVLEDEDDAVSTYRAG